MAAHGVENKVMKVFKIAIIARENRPAFQDGTPEVNGIGRSEKARFRRRPHVMARTAQRQDQRRGYAVIIKIEFH
jgi:hypothetical protein